MSRSLIAKIESGLERDVVQVDDVRRALASSDINERGIGYQVMSEPHLRRAMKGFKPRKSDPLACLSYLLDCVKQDLDWDEDYAHCREDALFELRVPLDPVWDQAGVGIGASDFWARVTAFMGDEMAVYDAGVVPHFLQSCDQDADFLAAMKVWKTDAGLSRYVEELEAASGVSV